jgi:hypothetical protein
VVEPDNDELLDIPLQQIDDWRPSSSTEAPRLNEASRKGEHNPPWTLVGKRLRPKE